MLRFLILLLLLIPLALPAQSLNDGYMFPGDETWEDPVYDVLAHPEYGMDGMLGSVVVDGVLYTQVRLLPEIAIWKLGLGLDIDLLIDGEGKLRGDNWDSWDDVLRKIFYVRFSDRTDSLYFKIGRIPDYTLGHGLIFDDFSNMLRYPAVKNIGGYLGVNTNSYGFGFEVYTHDISKNDIIAGRASLKPLQFLGLPLLKKLKLGVNAGADRNPYHKYPDADGDGYPDVYDKFPQDRNLWLDTDDDGAADNEDFDLNGNNIIDHPDLNPYVNIAFPDIAELYPNYPFDMAVYPDSAAQYTEAKPMWVYSLEYDLPLVENNRVTLSNYGEYAIMKDYGRGLIFPGFALRWLIFDTKLELRNFGDKFLPAYFNNLYDEQRCEVVHDTTITADGHRIYSLKTKDSLLEQIKSSLGWFAYLKVNIANFAHVKLAYQDMVSGDQTLGKSLWGKLTVMPERLPRLREASIYYAQTDVTDLDLKYPRNANSQIAGRLVYGYNDIYNLICKYQEFYTDLNADGRIKGADEIVESVTFGVEFKF